MKTVAIPYVGRYRRSFPLGLLAFDVLVTSSNWFQGWGHGEVNAVTRLGVAVVFAVVAYFAVESYLFSIEILDEKVVAGSFRKRTIQFSDVEGFAVSYAKLGRVAAINVKGSSPIEFIYSVLENPEGFIEAMRAKGVPRVGSGHSEARDK